MKNKVEQLGLSSDCEEIYNPHDRLVAFIDILGFKEYVNNIDRPGFYMTDEILTALKALENIKIQNERKFKYDWGMPNNRQITTFSDHIIISIPLEEPFCLTGMLQYLCEVSNTLLMLGMPFRGIVTSGKLFHQKNIVFGKALIEAYEAEKRLVHYPRIVILEPTFHAINDYAVIDYAAMDDRNAINEMGMVRQDFDGLYFLDFLKFSVESTKSGSYPLMETVRELIQKMIKTSQNNPSVIPKARWFASYFNRILKEFPQCSIQELDIDPIRIVS